MVKILVPLAEGSEEIEAITVIDVLRRAKFEVIIASVSDSKQLTLSRMVKIVAECLLSEVGQMEFDAIVIPGGLPGSYNLAQSELLSKIVKIHYEKNKTLAAICAAPAVVLDNILTNAMITCHPRFAEAVKRNKYVDKRVVVDKTIITSQGPGTALEFSLAIVSALGGESLAFSVKAPMVAHF